jgi:pyruvate dehydrogenase E2 component (dihydrolipoamide acetyltransferase)
VRADVDAAVGKAPAAAPAGAPATAPALATHAVLPGPIEQAIPQGRSLSEHPRTIARRLTEWNRSRIYLTVDILLDALLKLRGELNAGLESRG